MRIVKYPWHVGHDYELYKIPAQFFVLGDTHRRFATTQRPIPAHVKPVAEIRDAQADVMILHVDQWTWDEIDKRLLFLHYRDSFPGALVVINHGSNMVDGCSSAQMRELVGELPMVCNSPTAQRLWDVADSVYLRHGMSPEEWPESHHGRQNIVVTQPSMGLHDECRNGAAVLAFEQASGLRVDWVGRDRSFDSFAKYRAFLASSSVFFNPSYASANPRSRTEAMLCGVAVVTTGANGEDDYIVNGVNGFVSNDMEELYDALLRLHRDPGLARQVGLAGRRTAQEVFHSNRFVRRWQAVLDRVVQRRPIQDLDLQGPAY